MSLSNDPVLDEVHTDFRSWNWVLIFFIVVLVIVSGFIGIYMGV